MAESGEVILHLLSQNEQKKLKKAAKQRAKEAKKQREREHRAVLVLQCACRRNIARRVVADRREMKRKEWWLGMSEEGMVKERMRRWLTQRRLTRKPGYGVTNIVNKAVRDRERRSYHWVEDREAQQEAKRAAKQASEALRRPIIPPSVRGMTTPRRIEPRKPNGGYIARVFQGSRTGCTSPLFASAAQRTPSSVRAQLVLGQ